MNQGYSGGGGDDGDPGFIQGQQQQEQMYGMQNPEDQQDYIQENISELLGPELHNFLEFIYKLNIHPQILQAIISELYHVK